MLKAIFIDCSKVHAAGLSENETFKQKLSEMTADFAKPTFVHAVAVHEAGHAMYYSLQGAKRLAVSGPRIDFVGLSEKNPFPTYGAAIEDLDDTHYSNDTTGFYLTIKQLVAGGVAQQMIPNARNENLRGDIGADCSMYLEVCKVAEQLGILENIDRKFWWKHAWNHMVEEITEKPQIKEAIIQTAKNVKDCLYRWQGTPVPLIVVWPKQ
jgi:hypothetical protein